MEEKKVRWGLLSTARINERLIPCMRSNDRSEILAVGSRSQETADAFAKQWEIPRAYGSYDELLADADVNVIYLTLPNSMHTEWVIKAADAGKQMLCEKPMAQTGEDIDLIAAAARRNSVLVQEATMMRYHPQTLRLQQMIADGAIGHVRLMRGVMAFTLHRANDIRVNANLGGGSIWDLGSYCVNFMRTMMQANPIEVQGWQTPTDSDVDWSFSGQMRFANGTLGQFFSSFQSTPRYDAELIGSDGMIRLDLPWVNNVGVSSNIHIVAGEREQPGVTFADSTDFLNDQTITYENVNAYQDEINSMIDSILDGSPPIISLEDSRGNAVTLAALCKSVREGRSITL